MQNLSHLSTQHSPRWHGGFPAPFTLQSLVDAVPAIAQNECLRAALDVFRYHPGASAVAVLADERPVGMILRRMIADVVRLPCYRQRIADESCLCFVSMAPIVIEHDADEQTLARLLARRPMGEPADPFVVIRHGRYVGMVERDRLSSSLSQSMTI